MGAQSSKRQEVTESVVVVTDQPRFKDVKEYTLSEEWQIDSSIFADKLPNL